VGVRLASICSHARVLSQREHLAVCGVDDVSHCYHGAISRLRQRLRAPRPSLTIPPPPSCPFRKHLLGTSHRSPVCACPAISHKQAHTSITALRQSLYLALRRHGVFRERLIGRLQAVRCSEESTNRASHMQKTADAHVCDSKSGKESERYRRE
jgi:hypothetical protein